MALFRYRAVDCDGKTVEGTMEQTSAAQVTGILRDRGLQVSAVDEVGKGPGFSRLKSRLRWDDLDLLNHQLLAVTESGLPLAPSLRVLGDDIKSRRLRPVIDDIRTQVESGSTLEEALARHPESFSPVYTSIIRAGERTGNLSGVLSHLCTYSARMVEVRNSVQEAIAYPVLILAAACALIGFLLTRVVPMFAEMYADFGGMLPGPTQFWVSLSKFFVENAAISVVIVLGGLIGIYLVLRQLLRTESGGYTFDWIKLQVPILGKLYSAASTARFSRTLGLLLTSKVPVVESLDLAAAAAGNSVLRNAVTEVAVLVEGGESISDALASTGYFGHSFCWMLSTGEQRGEIDSTFLSLAETSERGVARMDKIVMMLLGPILIIILGIVVGSLIISLYLPIFMLGDAISGI